MHGLSVPWQSKAKQSQAGLPGKAMDDMGPEAAEKSPSPSPAPSPRNRQLLLATSATCDHKRRACSGTYVSVGSPLATTKCAIPLDLLGKTLEGTPFVSCEEAQSGRFVCSNTLSCPGFQHTFSPALWALLLLFSCSRLYTC